MTPQCANQRLQAQVIASGALSTPTAVALTPTYTSMRSGALQAQNGQIHTLLQASSYPQSQWVTKAQQAHADVLAAVNAGDSQSASAALEDANDGVVEARQMVAQMIQSQKDMFSHAQFVK